MRVPHPASSTPSTTDGSGTKTPARMTGHGAPPPSASGRGNELMSNNWGAKSLSKLQGPTAGAASAGYDRFMQPTRADTANVPPPGLGDPSGP